MTLFISNIDLIYNFFFIARGLAGSRRVRPEPTASLLMSQMSQYKILQVRSWYSKHFSTSPMLCAYPPIFYPGSAQYLAFSVVSISRRLLVMRRPLPIFGTIVANKYREGVYAKLLTLMEYSRIIRELKYVLLVCLLIGFSAYSILVPGPVLEMPRIFTSPDLAELLRIAKDTYIRHVCSVHEVPSPCHCDEALNKAMPIFLDSKELPSENYNGCQEQGSRCCCFRWSCDSGVNTVGIRQLLGNQCVLIDFCSSFLFGIHAQLGEKTVYKVCHESIVQSLLSFFRYICSKSSRVCWYKISCYYYLAS